MSDCCDDTDRAEEVIMEARRNAIAAKANIPAGVPGDCVKCGDYFTRLIGGACGRCRDKFNLP